MILSPVNIKFSAIITRGDGTVEHLDVSDHIIESKTNDLGTDSTNQNQSSQISG